MTGTGIVVGVGPDDQTTGETDHVTNDPRHAAPDEGDGGEPRGYQPGVVDRLRYLYYTLWPVQYTNEDSSTDEVLWQHTLELRAVRHWLALGTFVLLLLLFALVILVTRTT